MAYGVGPGDAIFTTPFTFIATAEVISLLGATPVFVDIDHQTYNIHPGQLDQAITAVKSSDPSVYPLPKRHSSAGNPDSPLSPKGIIPVDLFGLPADYDEIHAVAAEHGLFVIEDAAQSFGAERTGKKACALAEIACTSFFPAKPLGCYGDGGMCFTDSGELAEVLRSLLVHGKGLDKYDNVRIGLNGRLDTIQAAVLLAKFEIFPEEVTLRQKVSRRYTDLLKPYPMLSAPHIPEGYTSAWAQYSVLAENAGHRAELQSKLKDAGIPTAIYYPKPLHLQSAFAPLGYGEGDFAVSEEYAHRIFSLPMHPYLANEDQERIAALLGGG
jgi:dTDP-4-amino-4,6-dideoxygalactose transaminase